MKEEITQHYLERHQEMLDKLRVLLDDTDNDRAVEVEAAQKEIRALDAAILEIVKLPADPPEVANQRVASMAAHDLGEIQDKIEAFSDFQEGCNEDIEEHRKAIKILGERVAKLEGVRTIDTNRGRETVAFVAPRPRPLQHVARDFIVLCVVFGSAALIGLALIGAYG